MVKNSKKLKSNIIYNENNLITMNRFNDKSIDGIITSPPYNISTERKDYYYNTGYSENDGLSESEYINTRIKEFEQFDRILKNDGVICYNISYHNKNPMLPLLLICEVHEKTTLTLADIICWKKNNSIPFQTSKTKLSRIVENVYIFVHKDKLHDFKTNKKISKINEKTGQKFYKNYTNLIEAKNNDRFKTKLKAVYSTELVEKLIHIYFPEESLIYDPFMGVGTTAKGCTNKNCKYIGSEIVEEFYNDALRRLENE